LREVVKIFTTARLLVTNTVAGVSTVEVSHGALMREWKLLADWIHEAREDIQLRKAISEDAMEWKRRGHPLDWLYRGSQLSEALAWRERNSSSIDEDAFLSASIAERERQKTAEQSATLIDFFISYTRADRDWAEWIAWRLEEAGYSTVLQAWDFRPGANFVLQMDELVKKARRTIAVLSPDYLTSRFTASEWQAAFRLDPKGEQGLLLPVRVRLCDTEGLLSTTVYVDLVGLDESAARQRLLSAISARRSKPVHAPVFPGDPPVWAVDSVGTFLRPSLTYNLLQVFVTVGFPHVTFVEREDFGSLQFSLAQPGLGVIIEGPSGVGKTTTLNEAIKELAQQGVLDPLISVLKLSARKSDDQDMLKALPSQHDGIVIVDDFHRLDPLLKKKLIDYLKRLADDAASSDTEHKLKKLVIVGIPQTGQTLVDASFDVAMRIKVFKWGKVKDELIRQMIEKGEKALNIEFDQKEKIIFAANGSLNIAQLLCLYICQKGEVMKTSDQKRVVHCNMEAAISICLDDLSRKFGELTRRFAMIGGPRDIICLRLLEELAHSEDGFLSLSLLKEKNPALAYGIEKFISEKWMNKFSEEYPRSKDHLFFDQTAHALVIEDPQFSFYLRKVPFSQIAKEAGKVITFPQRRVFISYSHRDAKLLQRLQVHLKQLERDGIVDFWDDTKIVAGMKWREEIQAALESSAVAILLISADFLASDFITNYELPILLLRAETEGTTILPVIVKSCLFTGSKMDVFQAVNPPDKPLAEMTTAERDRVLTKLAKMINERLILPES